jgi:hypothetical protein
MLDRATREGRTAMTEARCDEHRPVPIEPETVSYALPLGYPDTAVTCDVIGCEKAARLWLSKDERDAFVAGQRVFPIASGAKIRVSDDLFPN